RHRWTVGERARRGERGLEDEAHAGEREVSPVFQQEAQVAPAAHRVAILFEPRHGSERERERLARLLLEHGDRSGSRGRVLEELEREAMTLDPGADRVGSGFAHAEPAAPSASDTFARLSGSSTECILIDLSIRRASPPSTLPGPNSIASVTPSLAIVR